MALDPCPHCGREFDHDNAGARSNHVASCAEKAAKYQQAGQDHSETVPSVEAEQHARDDRKRQKMRPGQTSTNPPSHPDDVPPRAQGTQQAGPPAHGQQQGQLPAQQQESVEAVQTGMQAAPAIETMISGNRGEQLQAAAGALAAVGQTMQDREQQQRERAKNASQETIAAAQEYPICDECDGQITSMPPAGEEFPCPHCGVMLIAP